MYSPFFLSWVVIDYLSVSRPLARSRSLTMAISLRISYSPRSPTELLPFEISAGF
jgi:ABC-type polysaccharide transport system permease subunit